MPSQTSTDTPATKATTTREFPTHPITTDATKAIFDSELRNVHLEYKYDVGNGEFWAYEMWFYSSDRIVYAIHGGPMAGRINFQTAGYQCIRPGELWQVNWLEETGTICSLVYDKKANKLSTLIGFSKGHWVDAEGAHGNKRNDEDFSRWFNKLAHTGDQWERYLLQEQADIDKTYEGPGNLEPFDPEQDTIFPPGHIDVHSHEKNDHEKNGH